ncbi:hypothetical protein SAMN05192558_11440 [Actinokineospora alba]|uniref:Uncharacterized protein n=1 Tax=Actinokineospora alba TaxID=504798 RepID=A0A1H0VHV5_9PSEU|nr:DUF5994 family protein [Actinokineospora alba]TDP67719.1 hypothetical protein C8E96_3269 [Actinokineospora alba]SDJ27560.1 hypothetical protein SAMN05421871_11240 [Actinokineospora alba]SDP77943.1 hypothetical protein SAMN05192558_11440 [Actinokineospora alba]
MTSGQFDHRATARAFTERTDARITMKPADATKGFFDGGWWPRSREPVEEFSALISSLAERSGPVDRIGYSRGSWDTAPDQLLVGENTVRLQGFRAMNAHTIVLIGPNLRRFTLLVVPAHAAADLANKALDTVAAADCVADAEQLLASITPF